eukprot:6297247-Amphidinium_carterae.1
MSKIASDRLQQIVCTNIDGQLRCVKCRPLTIESDKRADRGLSLVGFNVGDCFGCKSIILNSHLGATLSVLWYNEVKVSSVLA